MSDVTIKQLAGVLGMGVDKLITQLDHYKEVHRHLTATAMH